MIFRWLVVIVACIIGFAALAAMLIIVVGIPLWLLLSILGAF